jgi:hypothetical protein
MTQRSSVGTGKGEAIMRELRVVGWARPRWPSGILLAGVASVAMLVTSGPAAGAPSGGCTAHTGGHSSFDQCTFTAASSTLTYVAKGSVGVTWEILDITHFGDVVALSGPGSGTVVGPPPSPGDTINVRVNAPHSSLKATT